MRHHLTFRRRGLGGLSRPGLTGRRRGLSGVSHPGALITPHMRFGAVQLFDAAVGLCEAEGGEILLPNVLSMLGATLGESVLRSTRLIPYETDANVTFAAGQFVLSDAFNAVLSGDVDELEGQQLFSLSLSLNNRQAH